MEILKSMSNGDIHLCFNSPTAGEPAKGSHGAKNAGEAKRNTRRITNATKPMPDPGD